jgi:hypothetical protein
VGDNPWHLQYVKDQKHNRRSLQDQYTVLSLCLFGIEHPNGKTAGGPGYADNHQHRAAILASAAAAVLPMELGQKFKQDLDGKTRQPNFISWALTFAQAQYQRYFRAVASTADFLESNLNGSEQEVTKGPFNGMSSLISSS